MSATVGQIKARMDGHHAAIIDAVDAGRMYFHVPRWEVRMLALMQWECIVIGRSGQYAVTNKGREAVRAMRMSCGTAAGVIRRACP